MSELVVILEGIFVESFGIDNFESPTSIEAGSGRGMSNLILRQSMVDSIIADEGFP